jgi:cytochrome c oxidase subunit 2
MMQSSLRLTTLLAAIAATTLIIAGSTAAKPAHSAPSTKSAASPTAPSPMPDDVQVIEVTAKKYEFNPSPIRVKVGARVQLKITATDHVHGVKLSEVADGANGKPGLVFSSPQECLRVEKGQTQTLEFTAQAAGTYSIRCCVHCGWDHRSMKGQLIVEP